MTEDQSHLDRKYFIDRRVYNCPFCNRRNVVYTVPDFFVFDWTGDKECHAYVVACSSCQNRSLHFAWAELHNVEARAYYRFRDDVALDDAFFYHHPTSFFSFDKKIPKAVRDAISEAEVCLELNALTGASACARKAIYELLKAQGIEGDHYEERIKALKNKHPEVDGSLFDGLGHIQDMTSNKVHEWAWERWDSAKVRFVCSVLMEVLSNLYVVPSMRLEALAEIARMREQMAKGEGTGTREGA